MTKYVAAHDKDPNRAILDTDVLGLTDTTETPGTPAADQGASALQIREYMSSAIQRADQTYPVYGNDDRLVIGNHSNLSDGVNGVPSINSTGLIVKTDEDGPASRKSMNNFHRVISGSMADEYFSMVNVLELSGVLTNSDGTFGDQPLVAIENTILYDGEDKTSAQELIEARGADFDLIIGVAGNSNPSVVNNLFGLTVRARTRNAIDVIDLFTAVKSIGPNQTYPGGMGHYVGFHAGWDDRVGASATITDFTGVLISQPTLQTVTGVNRGIHLDGFGEGADIVFGPTGGFSISKDASGSGIITAEQKLSTNVTKSNAVDGGTSGFLNHFLSWFSGDPGLNSNILVVGAYESLVYSPTTNLDKSAAASIADLRLEAAASDVLSGVHAAFRATGGLNCTDAFSGFTTDTLNMLMVTQPTRVQGVEDIGILTGLYIPQMSAYGGVSRGIHLDYIGQLSGGFGGDVVFGTDANNCRLYYNGTNLVASINGAAEIIVA